MHLTEEQISQYSDALRSNSENELPIEIVEHVEDCQECKVSILEVVSILDEMEKSGNGGARIFNINSKAEKLTFYLKAAAVAFIIVLPGYFLLRYKNIREHDNLSYSVKHSVQQNMHDKKDIAEDLRLSDKKTSGENVSGKDVFTPIQEYEAVSGDTFRSVKIDVRSPLSAKIVTGKVNFNISMTQKEEYSITILNNRDLPVYTKKFNNNIFVKTISLPEGLYYWKLENPNELLHLGKFTIQKH